MNNATKHDLLPPLVADLLNDPVTYIDNVFADGWKRLRISCLIGNSGLTKRTGTQASEAVYLLLIWRWLNVSSIGMFAHKALGLFSQAKKDVMYDLLKREDINWRTLNLTIGAKLYKVHKLQDAEARAFVLDDSIKARRGKKMEGVSNHFDHVSNTSIKGQQVLTLGLSTDKVFVPLDSQIAISTVNTQGLNRKFKDGRSAGAQRYDEAIGQTKVQMATGMIRRAVRQGIRASFVIADAWFGNKDMMRAAMKLNMVAILRMKRGKTKYRVPHGNGYRFLDAKQLYQRAVRKQWTQVADLPWKAVEMEVEIDLSTQTGVNAKPNYQSVKLLFVRGINDKEDRTASRKDWALFLSTDAGITSAKMLQVYALRWSIEVYFKEAKQHLGFLQEQTRTFVSHTASIHLCAIRYLMLADAKLISTELSIGQVRSQVQDQFDSLNYAARLWGVFRSLVAGTLKSMSNQLNCTVENIMEKLDERVSQFLIQALQLDTFTMCLEHQEPA